MWPPPRARGHDRRVAVKVFDLGCKAGHLFEGWFDSQDDFDAQRRGGQIGCPLCGSTGVDRRPSAPRLNLGAPAEPPARATAVAAELQTALVRAALKMIAGTEDVGERFAEEARRIHYQEAAQRGIRGVATRAQAQELAEEGVPVMALPAGDLFKQTLQ